MKKLYSYEKYELDNFYHKNNKGFVICYLLMDDMDVLDIFLMDKMFYGFYDLNDFTIKREDFHKVFPDLESFMEYFDKAVYYYWRVTKNDVVISGKRDSNVVKVNFNGSDVSGLLKKVEEKSYQYCDKLYWDLSKKYGMDIYTVVKDMRSLEKTPDIYNDLFSDKGRIMVQGYTVDRLMIEKGLNRLEACMELTRMRGAK